MFAHLLFVLFTGTVIQVQYRAQYHSPKFQVFLPGPKLAFLLLISTTSCCLKNAHLHVSNKSISFSTIFKSRPIMKLSITAFVAALFIMSVAASPVPAPQAAPFPTAAPRLVRKSLTSRSEKLAFPGKWLLFIGLFAEIGHVTDRHHDLFAGLS